MFLLNGNLLFGLCFYISQFYKGICVGLAPGTIKTQNFNFSFCLKKLSPPVLPLF